MEQTGPTPAPSRLSSWVALAFSSAVVFGATADEIPPNQRQLRDKFTLAFTGITLSLGCIASVTNLSSQPVFSPKLVSQIEDNFIYISFLCSIIVVSMNMHNIFIVEDQNGNLVIGMNANIYFFSWAIFFSSLYLISSNIKHFLTVAGECIEHDLTNFSNRIAKWFILFMFGIVIIGSSSFIYSQTDCKSSKQCNRTILSISLGVITVFLSCIILIMVLTKKFQHLNLLAETILSVLIAVFYIVCVGIITGSDSPGRFIGNLYFFTWLSFLLSVILAMECIRDFMKERSSESSVSLPVEEEREIHFEVMDMDVMNDERKQVDVTDIEYMNDGKMQVEVTDMEDMNDRRKQVNVTDMEDMNDERIQVEVIDVEYMKDGIKQVDVTDMEDMNDGRKQMNMTDMEDMNDERIQVEVIDVEYTNDGIKQVDVTDMAVTNDGRKQVHVTDMKVMNDGKMQVEVTNMEDMNDGRKQVYVTDIEEID